MSKGLLLCVAILLLAPACGSGGQTGAPDGGMAPPDAGGGPEPDAAPPPSETCAQAELAPCTAAAGAPGADAVLVKGTVLADTLLCSGEVLYSRSQGKLLCVGPDCSGEAAADGAPVVCADVVSPGLIDGHSHSNYNTLPRFKHPGILYPNRAAWRLDDTFGDYQKALTGIRNTY